MKHLKLCLILMFTSSLLSGCHTASLPQKEISQTVAPIAALEVAGAIPSEKIAWFNSDYFNLDGKDEMRNMMLSSVYKDVREIDLYKLFYNGIPETCNDICDEEKKILSAIDAGATYTPLPAFSVSFFPPLSPFSRHHVKKPPITFLSLPHSSTLLANQNITGTGSIFPITHIINEGMDGNPKPTENGMAPRSSSNGTIEVRKIIIYFFNISEILYRFISLITYICIFH